MSVWRRLIGPLSRDDNETARREYVFCSLLRGMLLASLLYFLSTLVIWGIMQGSWPEVGRSLFLMVMGLLAYALTRRGWTRLASYMVVGAMVILALYIIALGALGHAPAVLYVFAAAVSAFLIGGRTGLVIATLETLAYAGLRLYLLAHPRSYQYPMGIDIAAVGVIIYLLYFVGWLYTRETNRALRQAQAQADELLHSDREKAALLVELQNTAERQRKLLDTVIRLSTPVIPVWEGVIVLPLIGHVDQERVGHLSEALLQGVTEHQAKVALIDVTGVTDIDPPGVRSLLETAEAVRLLGAEPVFTGLQARVARIILGLGLDLSDVEVRSDLREGVEYALEKLGRGYGEQGCKEESSGPWM